MNDETENPKAATTFTVTARRKQKNAKRAKPLAEAGSRNAEFLAGTPVVIYIRVSSEEQTLGYSLSAQEHACRQFAQTRGWNVIEVYEESGISAKDEERAAFQRMMRDAQSQRFKVVLIHKLDRFSRNIDNTLKSFRYLDEQDVTLASVTEDFDYSTPMGRMFFRMMAVFAQWYLENLSAETIKGKKERARKGQYNGHLPFGYRLQNGVGTPVPAESAAVQQAFQNYASGLFTDGQIAENLNEQGFITRRNRHWSKDAVREMLQNEFYCGVVAYRESLYPGNHPAIIAQDLFEQCQNVRAQHRSRTRSFTARPKRTYLLQRVAHCAACNRPLRMQYASGYGYYKEVSQQRGLTCDYAKLSVRMDRADRQVLDLLKGLRLPDNWQRAIEQLAANTEDMAHAQKERERIEQRLQRLGRACR